MLLLGLSGPVLAEDAGSGSPPDAALLEFIAEWQDEDQRWLDAEMHQMQVEGQQSDTTQPTAAQESGHE